MKKILTQDHDIQQVSVAHADGEGGLIIETSQNVTDVIEKNKAEYAATDPRARWGEWNKVASIPLVCFQELNEKGICRGFSVIDQKRMKAWLNDPDNRFFRTRPGRL